MIRWLETHMLTCPIKSAFGIDCPGCGMQRAFISLLKGNVLESLQYHAALIPFVLTIIVLLVQLKANYTKGGYLVMWLFIFTAAITMIQFGVRLLS